MNLMATLVYARPMSVHSRIRNTTAKTSVIPTAQKNSEINRPMNSTLS
jgi:hypothetical protein